MSEAVMMAQCRRCQKGALLLGILAAAVSLVGAFVSRTQFFQSYLIAWLFWSGISFGALVIVMMQFLTGGLWGLALRNFATAAFRTLPWMAVFFVPVLLGVHDIFRWSNGARGEAPGYAHKAQYLNLPFFTSRAVFYFVVLSVVALLLRRAMLVQGNARSVSRRLAILSVVGLIAYVLCMNFAATDWVMSLNPSWYSTIFVEIFVTGQFLSALALLTALVALFAAYHSLGEFIPPKAFQDLGNMLLAFVIFWAYVCFSQFIIIWSGNLPKEISWYLERSTGGWQWYAGVLVLGQFFLPFLLLLSRGAKRKRESLAAISIVLVGGNLLAIFWLLAPSFHPGRFYVHWLDFTEMLALGGFWFALFFRYLTQAPFLPAQLTEAARNG